MLTRYSVFVVLVVMTLGLVPPSQAQITRHYYQSYELPKNIQTIELYARSPHVVVRRTKCKTLHIQTSVTTNISNIKLLDLLALKGRYAWNIMQPELDTWQVYSDCQPNELIYRNVPAQEDLVYLVTIPRRLREFYSKDCEKWEEASMSYVQQPRW